MIIETSFSNLNLCPGVFLTSLESDICVIYISHKVCVIYHMNINFSLYEVFFFVLGDADKYFIFSLRRYFAVLPALALNE